MLNKIGSCCLLFFVFANCKSSVHKSESNLLDASSTSGFLSSSCDMTFDLSYEDGGIHTPLFLNIKSVPKTTSRPHSGMNWDAPYLNGTITHNNIVKHFTFRGAGSGQNPEWNFWSGEGDNPSETTYVDDQDGLITHNLTADGTISSDFLNYHIKSVSLSITGFNHKTPRILHTLMKYHADKVEHNRIKMINYCGKSADDCSVYFCRYKESHRNCGPAKGKHCGNDSCELDISRSCARE